MQKIIKLDKILENQISAGEVVERPVSVVKELVENSIDAKSLNIRIEIINGGKNYIYVSDDGEGIGKEDLEISIDKHTTSKIKSLEDLYNVMTFGFRGEALSSISSVSIFCIISKTKNSINAYKLDFDNISGKKISKTSLDIGTKIIVKDLFFNTPARLNYLKTDKTEYSKILDYLYSISLSYPNIGFEFIADNKKIFKFNSGEDLKTRIYNIYGNDFFSNILDINFNSPGLNISGFITNPTINFVSKSRQNLFVNHRPISSSLIFKAISDSYNRFIPNSTYPGYVLNIEIDPTIIDVNVHPRKQEIRFAQEQNIFKNVYNVILKKLETSSLISINDNNFYSDTQNNEDNIKKIETNDFNEEPKYYTGSGTKFKSYSPYKNISQNPNQVSIGDSLNFTKIILDNNTPFENNNSGDLHYTKLGKIVGQIFNSYILIEKDSKIIIIDQHALGERIIYEKLVKNEYKGTSQILLIQENIKLTPSEFTLVQENNGIFNEMGFEFEFLSNSILSITSIPDFIKKENFNEIFLLILNDISLGNILKSKNLDEIKNKIFAFTACRSAIKFGNKLNLFEMNKLLNDSVNFYSSTCPHGRNSFYEIGLNELKSKFSR